MEKAIVRDYGCKDEELPRYTFSELMKYVRRVSRPKPAQLKIQVN